MTGHRPTRDEPFTAYDAPSIASFFTFVSIIVGSELLPDAGSVMTKAKRTSASAMGWSYLSFWASVPTLASKFILPSSESGAVQGDRTKNEPVGFFIDRSLPNHRQA